MVVTLALVAFAPALRNGFVKWDDDTYVEQNPCVSAPDGLLRIWTTLELPQGFPNYPLVFTSYWLEYRLWGTAPAGYHATNVALHAASGLLVWALLRALGLGRRGACLAACLFAVHPLQVESVAWVTQRKNVLSGLFFLGSLVLYARYRRAGGTRRYLGAIAACGLALLSKTATVSLPISMLLTDWLIDRRFTRRGLVRVLPMLALALAAGMVTLWVERTPPQGVPPGARPVVAAAIVLFYVWKLLVPTILLAVYPRWDVDLSSAMWWLPLPAVLAACAAAYWGRRRLNHVLQWGAGHFICSLLPVLGLIPFGYMVHSFVADHFVYLACIGVFAAAGTGVDYLSTRPASPRTAGALFVTAWASVISLVTLTWHQNGVWKDSGTLWRHTLAANPRSWIAHHNYGAWRAAQGDDAEAAVHYRRALELNDRYPGTYLNLANLHVRRGALPEAERIYRRLLEQDPDNAQAHANLGYVLGETGRIEEAVAHDRRAIALAPSLAGAYANLGKALKAQGRYAQAATVLREGLANAAPDVWVANNLAWLLATCPDPAVRDGQEAVRWARRAVELAGRPDPAVLDTLAAALAERGDFDEAVRTARQAVLLATEMGDVALSGELRDRERLYEARKPYREPAESPQR